VRVRVSFDGNFRAKLWEAWNGQPQSILHALMALADIAFADHRDIALVLGKDVDGTDPLQRFAGAATAAFAAFPHLKTLAATVRTQPRADHHQLGAMLASRDGGTQQCAPIELGNIVDRIGTGDAFAAGVLHGMLSGMSDTESLAFGQAAGALKHYFPGDALNVDVDAVQAVVNGERLDVRR